MKNREQKKKDLEALKKDLDKVTSLIVAGFSGITVEQDYELRKQVRLAGGKYRVVKNTVAELAAKGTPAEAVLKGLSGGTAIAYTDKDAVALAKALTAYAKTHPVLTFKAGGVEGRVFDIKHLSDLATMPSKEELISKMLFLINSPAQRLATVLGAVARNLAVVVDQAVKEKKFGGEAEEPAVPA
jgi:large subunit ribosomal protein L10